MNSIFEAYQKIQGKAIPIVEETTKAPASIFETEFIGSLEEALLQEFGPIEKPTEPIVEVKKVPEVTDLKTINSKLNQLQDWVKKLASSGSSQSPGSGEVEFRWLDDVKRNTMTSSNDNWVLEYDAQTKSVQFTEHVGEIRSVKLNTSGPQTELIPGQFAWNSVEDCLDIAQSDGTTLQAGLEQYIQVRNSTEEVIRQGTVVGFAGVNGGNIPTVVPFVAGVTTLPLYMVGITTSDIQAHQLGRATTFGKVRTLNTTGSTVGETWSIGDLLWVHPTQAGKLTKVQPTSPNPAISVAAILKVGTNDGIILVRPSIFPRLWNGDWFDTTNQTLTTINTAKRVSMNSTGIAVGFTNDSGLITAQHTGQYNFQFSVQVISTNSSVAYFYIWYRKNGIDVPHTTTKLSISSNSAVLAPSWNYPVSMQANDTFELMWAADSTNVSLQATGATAFCPSIPSVIMTVQQINL